MTFKQIYIYELITNTIYLFVHFIFLIFQSVGLKNNQQLEMKFLHITRIIQFLTLLHIIRGKKNENMEYL
ncbi:hypothetical protein PFNF135_00594 [Plasmodium falciparum NF135/5.C10]|uniref:Uncharacterized protein n=1 Tax=Plasmodium falciparum NF135/5.C10 TaxID=1036726 RepID=W4INI2_PLAFA|nr:hypothetical protein PFNF135_00594 [Plasmodium falciparum NF135/5.C10]